MARSLSLVALIVLGTLCLAQSRGVRYKRPVCPGIFYPAAVEQLRSAVQQYVTDAHPQTRDNKLAAIVVPQSIYPFSGSVAAHAFKTLQPGQYDRVIILTPSNFASFRGCSIPAVDCLVTPIGPVTIDMDAANRAAWSPLIDKRGLSYAGEQKGLRAELHEREHGDEVNLPFLQVQLQQFKLVPIVVGDFVNYFNKPDLEAIDAVAMSIEEIYDNRTLLVVSSDFTRYGNKFSFVPFTENVLDGIKALDDEAIGYVLNRDVQGFSEYLKRTKDPINGANALMIMMRMLPETAEGIVLNYDVSGRIKNDTESSVSYAAIAFYDRSAPPAEVKPLKAPPAKAAEARTELPAQTAPVEKN